MKVNHRAFTGGYKFKQFEGQPSGSIQKFTPKLIGTGLPLEPDEKNNAAQVLNTLQLTTFEGPESSDLPRGGYIEPSEVKHIIINAVEVEPYNLPNEIILKDSNVILFADGLKAIKASYHNAEVVVVASEEQTTLLKRMSSVADNLSWLEIYAVTSKYPANLKELLYPMLFNNKYAVGYAPAHFGCLFMTISDVFIVEKVINRREVANSTFVGLAGPGWHENIILEIPIGTSIKEIKDVYAIENEVRLIKNSVITGDVLNDEVKITYDIMLIIALPEGRDRKRLFFLRPGSSVDSFGNTFISRLLSSPKLSADTNLHGERRACVSCTYCQSVCPVGLMPHLLHKHGNKEIINKRLANYRIYDCIECGLCDYVCPSKVEVLSDIKKGKMMLEKADISHNQLVVPHCEMILDKKVVKAHE